MTPQHNNFKVLCCGQVVHKSQHNGNSIPENTENISKQSYYFRCVVNHDPSTTQRLKVVVLSNGVTTQLSNAVTLSCCVVTPQHNNFKMLCCGRTGHNSQHNGSSILVLKYFQEYYFRCVVNDRPQHNILKLLCCGVTAQQL